MPIGPLSVNSTPIPQDSADSPLFSFTFATTVVKSAKGYEQRNSRWMFPQRAFKPRWTVGGKDYPGQTLSYIDALRDLFLGAQVSPTAILVSPNVACSFTSELPVYLGSNQFQLCKRSFGGAVVLGRYIKYPISFTITQGKSAISSGSYTASGGVVTYAGYKPMDIMWVVDRTNSALMPYVSGTALTLSKAWIQSSNTTIGNYVTGNRMGLVTYDNTSSVAQTLTATTATINSAVSSITSSSNTPDVAGALSTAATSLAAATSGSKTPCIILVTSGQSSTSASAAIASTITANPTWTIVVIQVNHPNGSANQSSVSNWASDAYYQANTSDSFAEATTRIMGRLMGATGTFSIPTRPSSDCFKVKQDGEKFGWEDASFIEFMQSNQGYVYNSAPSRQLDYITLPVDYSPGTAGGQCFNVLDYQADSGFRSAKQRYARGVGEWEIGWDTKSYNDIERLGDFFQSRMGRLRGFLFNDKKDNTFSSTLGTGDGSVTTFQLFKSYNSVPLNLLYPSPGSLVVKVAGVTKTEWADYAVDYTTGIITFTTAPTSGQSVTASGSFLKAARFGSDTLQVAVGGGGATSGPTLGTAGNMPIVEIL